MDTNGTFQNTCDPHNWPNLATYFFSQDLPFNKLVMNAHQIFTIDFTIFPFFGSLYILTVKC